MITRTRQAVLVLASAVVLGVLGDSLLRGVPWGLGASLWFVSLTAVAIFVYGRYGKARSVVHWMWLPLLFSCLFLWRDSPSLRGINGLGLMATLVFASLPAAGVCFRSSRLFNYLKSTLGTVGNLVAGVVSLSLADLEFNEPWSNRIAVLFRRTLKGFLITAPLVFVFSILLMSADPVFERLLRSAFDWQFSTAFSHLMLSAALAWIVAGYLSGIFRSNEEPNEQATMPRILSLGIVEIGIALGSLVLLFLVFVVVQIEYLFGGESLILATEGLSYAEYARSGFFELVAVAALVVPVLLAVNSMLVQKSERDRQSYQALATVTLILVALIMASALHRMFVYTDAYGLTHDRVYASVFMGWIGTVLGLFAGTVLFGSGRTFVFASCLSGFAFLGLLNFANPDALIVRTNIARAELGETVDVPYLASLSADAVPTIVSRASSLPVEDRCKLLQLLAERPVYSKTGWRSWNLGRFRAALAFSEPRLARNTILCGEFGDGWSPPHCVVDEGIGVFYALARGLFRKVCSGSIVPPKSRRTIPI